jgi:hypothetical protein
MKSFSQLKNIVGWVVFGIATIVYALSAEPTGSLWDCGEFIAGAYKLQVVHPPGAPLFILVGRMFTFVAETLFPNDPSMIAYSVNLMSGVCTAFAATFAAWSTITLGKMALVGRSDEMTTAQTIVTLGAGLVAGLGTAFTSSVWFSAVEGEVYAMSFFFTSLVFWAMLKWYSLPDTKDSDRWIVFACYMAGLSIGVHLLSLLTFPALALLYYFKKFENHNLRGGLISLAAGAGVLVLVQAILILNLPKVGAGFDLFFVNSLGMPFGSGLLFFIMLLAGSVVFGLYYAHKKVNPNLQKAVVAFSMVLIGFSTYGTILIRANANTPINMNDPSDVFSLTSYLNREQYGDRPLLRGPHYAAGRPIRYDTEDRYAPVGDKYEVVDRKITPIYNPADMMFLPRRGHIEKKQMHETWSQYFGTTKPSQADNMRYLFTYQINWMYWRYFMWNFVGRQNGEQGYYPWDVKSGQWLSGVSAIDGARLYNQSQLPETMELHQARNKYYFLPLIFGLLGLFFFAKANSKDFLVTMVLFLLTGLAIIAYSNQPPNEPRERDYVLVGSFMVYCMWMGFGVIALWKIFVERLKINSNAAAIASLALVLTAPIVMGFQNWDDHSRGSHTGARDYAINFLESCEENAIIFTHGDNDTYPLWYAQEVENIRTDVRVVNLSLLAVDWYIDQLRRKVNNSPAIKMTIPESGYRGFKRNQVMHSGQGDALPAGSTVQQVIKFIGEDHPLQLQGGSKTESFLPTKTITVPVDKAKVLANGTVLPKDSARITPIRFTINKNSLIKDETAVLDIIASNNWDRPIYFAVTCRPEKTLGMADYLQLEGMAFRLVPVKTASDRSLGFIGSGQVAADKTYENIMTKFKWGNFDKERLFVDRSYAPSVMSMRLVVVRLARHYNNLGQKDKVAKLLDTYFDAYPHMNFPYDYNTLMLIGEYYRAGLLEEAKEHVRILANESAEYMNFYNSISSDDLQSFQFDYQQTQNAVNRLNSLIEANDDAFKNEIRTIIIGYVQQQQPQQPRPKG